METRLRETAAGLRFEACSRVKAAHIAKQILFAGEK